MIVDPRGYILTKESDERPIVAKTDYCERHLKLGRFFETEILVALLGPTN